MKTLFPIIAMIIIATFSTMALFAQNVGIGTATPVRKLEVTGGWQTARISSTTSGATLEFNSDGSPDWQIGQWSNTFRILSSNDEYSTLTDEYLFTQSTFRPWTTNSKTLGASSIRWSNIYSVDANMSGLLTGYNGYLTGALGIGTLSPARNLEVTGGWRTARISSADNGASLEFVSASNPDWGVAQWQGTLRLISSSDNFSSSNDEFWFTQNEFRPYANNAKNIGTSTNQFATLYSVDGLFTGNVGAGTQNPVGKLHVHDAASELSTVYITPMNTSSGDSSRIFLAEDHDATYGMYWLYDGAQDEMELWGKASSTVYGPHLLVKRGTGNVAIGNTFATGYKLSVNGKIIATEMRVNLVANWPDYVFRDDYPLMPLNQLGEFVRQNGHLPNVPPAAEIEESGMDVGEMQRLMMEKIEELSLYIIRQNERIDRQQEEINTLRDRLDPSAGSK